MRIVREVAPFAALMLALLIMRACGGPFEPVFAATAGAWR